ncbi:MAG TPA: TetR family transcriptional regulator [Solirubrobacteraceae bacterium]|jgi:AcrR family transcriptional regulator|nr:TetR family transcriptional regulator [Solirubrobacteraceae bacterium]
MTTTRLTRSERTALTRRELLEAAERRFFADGYHGTTLDDIADEAGYTKGAVYSTFRSKAGLFLALFDEVAERRLREISELLSAHDRPEELVAALARQPVVEANAQFLLLAIEFWVHAAHEPDLLEAFSGRYLRLRASLCALAPQGGALEPETWAIVTLALSNGLALERLIDPAGVPGDLMAIVQAQITQR